VWSVRYVDVRGCERVVVLTRFTLFMGCV
jgi:hypothetical protein